MAAKKSTTTKTVTAKTATAKAAKPETATLVVGEQAPGFTLPSNEGRDLSLSDFRGKNVIVYFYPRDETPGCTREAHGFRDAKAELGKRNAVVLGVSKDSVESHQRFAGKHSLGFPLLSDRGGETIARWGAWGEKNMYGKKSMGIVRSTVIVAPDGTVKAVFPKVKVDQHVAEVLAALDR